MDRRRGLWLIDAGYLFSSQNTVEPGFQFDYRKLRDVVESDGPLWRAYYLNSTPNPPSDAQNGFHTWLRSAPPNGPKIITKLYELKPVRADRAYCDTCGVMHNLRCPNERANETHRLTREQQKGVDVGLATLALTLSSEYDTLLLSSGDGDLLDAVEYLSQRGKNLELVVFKAGVATELQARADRIYWIDDIKDDVRR
jgi:uncharacterized LabA/DUF88 family protein